MNAKTRRVRIVDDSGALALAAAEHLAALAHRAVESKGSFSVALSGGSTPRVLYRTLAAPPYRLSVPWTEMVVLVGDERRVPPDHADSNYRMIHEELLSRVPVQPARVCRFQSEERDERGIVERYEREMRGLLSVGPLDVPRLDLVLLGLGADGHTAGLFPGSTALNEQEHLAAVSWVESLGAQRFTLTLPAINRAAEAMFLVSGKDKASMLRKVLEGQAPPEPLPAQRVRPQDGTLLWLVDRAAAAELSPSPPATP